MNKEFQVHILNERGIVKARNLAANFDNLLTSVLEEIFRSPADQIASNYSNGREVALVRTHLELASFYAKKAMAMIPENQKEEVNGSQSKS